MNDKYIRKNKHGLYYIPDDQLHRPVAAVVAKGKVWEEQTINFIIDNLDNKSVITAGAYYGDFIPAISKETNGTVFTYEPVPKLFECAKKTIDLNKLHNVIIENKALSNKSGYVTVELMGKRNDLFGKRGEEIVFELGGASRIVSNTSPTTIEVESATLDSLIPNDCEISVIHLDVEGHENEALEGAMQLIKNNLPIIIVETFSSSFFEKHLAPLGYICNERVHDNTILKNDQPRA